MRLHAICVLVFAIIGVLYAQSTSGRKEEEINPRLFLSTFTVILSTVTSTSIVGTTTTCTTSSSAMNACSAIGRRRRGILYDEDEKLGRIRRGLFYDEDEIEDKDGSISLSSGRTNRSVNLIKEAPGSSVTINDSNSVPLNIQSGFNVPDGFFTGTPRFKLAYGTTTVITTSTSIATRSLFIFCSSITDYQVCSGTG
ncbi:hypothetical protein OUZ56_011752 [Daphnia magna]|uniref:Uncharacterized protein n=1 Tax=Daphnia magna TaxID=35525 RepID=A0ABQ9Z2C6_9CRUS|nr:hypothetical protein OUZ56_011752 [Daphnia magna]